MESTKSTSNEAQCGNKSKPLLSEVFLLTNGFIKTKGQFGEYFLHEKHQLFRCWFFENKLQIGKKDVEKNTCFWLSTIDTKEDFKTLFRLLTKEELITANGFLEENGFSFETGV